MTTLGEQSDEGTGHEVVLVVNQVPSPGAGANNPISGLVGLAAGLVGAVASVIDHTVIAGVNAALDRLVPIAVNVVVDRIDLTQIVLDRVDIDAIVARANMDGIIDRVPMVEIANYIIDEIDLPKIIRESTGGIATDAVNAARLQSLSLDEFINKISDSIIFRRKKRKVESPAGADSEGDA
ncbi:MAG: hypothetical protein CK552_00220 [Actinobacteria bacterium]|nr:MAG: hypothetical protein CK552_00220 [Actinomycetota bacterium]